MAASVKVVVKVPLWWSPKSVIAIGMMIGRRCFGPYDGYTRRIDDWMRTAALQATMRTKNKMNIQKHFARLY